MDTNFNMGFHADGASDRFTLTRDGNLSVSGTVSGSNLSGTNTGDQTNISGNSATTSQRSFSGDVSTDGMGRFTGWYTGTAATGLAAEIGISAGQAYIIAYNRQTSTYGTLNLESSAATLRLSGSTVNVVSGALQQGGNQVLHASNYTSYTYSTTDADSRFLRGTTNPGSVNNFTISIGNNGTYSYVQSHSGQPLHLNPVGNSVFIGSGSTVLHSSNYNSYSPTLTGGGASGTWGISITGNAATLGGYSPNQTGGAYNIVQRDVNGYIQNNYFYMSGGGSERNSSGLGYVAGFNSSDYYVRSYNSTAVASFLGLGSMAYASTGSYLALSGGTMTGTITITSSDIRSNASSGWTGDPGSQGKIQYHSNRWYIVADQDSNRIVQFRRNGTDVSYIDNNGVYQGSISGNADTVDGLHASSFSRKDTTGQWIKPYYEYGSYIGNDAPSTLANQMGGGGLRVDFQNPGATGTWSHTITWSGYNRYSMSQIGTNYNTTDARLYYRQTSNHDDSWVGWKQFAFYNDSPTFQEVYANGWFRTTGSQGLYNPTNDAHFYPNNASYGAWRIDGSRNGWHGLHFSSGSTLMMNGNETGVHREGYGWQWRWDNGTFYVHGNSYGGGAGQAVIHAGNIGSQTVSNADYVAAQTNPVGNFNVGLSRPKGASYTTTASVVTGAIKIKLPPGVPVHGMWKMTVKIYEYGQRGNGYTIELGCHLYPSTAYNRYQWMLTTDTGAVLPIRYGTDGSSGCVWIGENGTVWSYPQIHVTEFSNGFNNPGGVNWTTGTWGVTIGAIDNSVAVDGPYTTSLIAAAYATSAGSATSATSASYADSIYWNGNQRLYGGSDGTRNTGWAYHNDNGTGLHWPNNGWHIYPINASDMYIRSGATDCSLKFTRNGTTGGYVHCSAANEIGFLTTGRSWSLRVDDSGNVFPASSIRSPIYYDSNDTAKYLQRNTSTYTSWFMGGANNGYSGWNVDGGMHLMIHTSGTGAPCGFYHQSLGWSALFYVNGTSALFHAANEKIITQSYGVYVTGEIRASSDITAYYSDIRLKKDIDVIPDAIEKIKQLRGVTYTWNDEEVNVVKNRSGQRDIGLIAQEVEAVEPLFTKEYQTPLDETPKDAEAAANFTPRMSETYKTIKYDKLVALLVEGMKEQQLQIEELKNKLDLLTQNK
jgi:hypothetical protein